MEKTKAFYKLSAKRQAIEEQLEEYNVVINELRSEAKKLKKGSLERQDLMRKANEISNSSVFIKLQTELRVMNFCINTVWYN